MATGSRSVWCVLGLGAALIGLALSQDSEPEGRVTVIFHDVQLLPAQADARPAAVNDAIDEGSAVKTGTDSRSELTFADLTITRLGANTVFSVNKAGRSVHLDSGSILLYAKKDSGGAEIATKAVSVGITGTTVIFESEPMKHDRLTVLEGTARFTLNDHPDQTTEVRRGQVLNVNAGAKKLPKPGRVDLRRILNTHPLIKDFPPLPSLDLILATTSGRNPPGPRPIASSGPQGGSPPVYVPNPPGPPSRPPPIVGGYPGPIPTPTPRRPSPTPTATVKPTPRRTPRPTPRPTYAPRPPPKPTPTPKRRFPPPKKRPIATPSPTQIIR